MSEWDEYYDQWNTPREWSDAEIDEKFNELYESIMAEVKEIIYANTKASYFTYKSKNRYSPSKRHKINDAIYSGVYGTVIINIT